MLQLENRGSFSQKAHYILMDRPVDGSQATQQLAPTGFAAIVGTFKDMLAPLPKTFCRIVSICGRNIPFLIEVLEDIGCEVTQAHWMKLIHLGCLVALP